MDTKSLLAVAVLCLVLCVAIAVFTEDASAQASADKELATKTGVGESLGTKEFEEDKLPGALEVGLAVGSIIAMIAVIKYL